MRRQSGKDESQTGSGYRKGTDQEFEWSYQKRSKGRDAGADPEKWEEIASRKDATFLYTL